jgi:hypothetical protein
MDRYDQVVDDSGKPHVWIDVEAEHDSAQVAVRLWTTGKQGVVNAITMRYPILEAKQLADTIMGAADELEEAQRNGEPDSRPPLPSQDN